MEQSYSSGNTYRVLNVSICKSSVTDEAFGLTYSAVCSERDVGKYEVHRLAVSDVLISEHHSDFGILGMYIF